MISFGKRYMLTPLRDTPHGWILDGKNLGDVLLPKKFAPEEYKEEEIDVFIFPDHMGRATATTQQPIIMLGEMANLKMVDLNQTGAFFDWGLDKHLMVPYSELGNNMKEGGSYLVFLYWDLKSNRLVGTTKVDKVFGEFVEDKNDWDLERTYKGIIIKETPKAYKVLVEKEFSGLVYKNERKSPMHMGEEVQVKIKQIRPDLKVDLALIEEGVLSDIDEAVDALIAKLKADGNFIPLTDKSSKEAIFATFKMSKKLFKKAVGNAYRKRLITLETEGIRLVV